MLPKSIFTNNCISGKQYHLGLFSDEVEAATAVNKKCVELGLPLKNPELYVYTDFLHSKFSFPFNILHIMNEIN